MAKPTIRVPRHLAEDAAPSLRRPTAAAAPPRAAPRSEPARPFAEHEARRRREAVARGQATMALIAAEAARAQPAEPAAEERVPSVERVARETTQAIASAWQRGWNNV